MRLQLRVQTLPYASILLCATLQMRRPRPNLGEPFSDTLNTKMYCSMPQQGMHAVAELARSNAAFGACRGVMTSMRTPVCQGAMQYLQRTVCTSTNDLAHAVGVKTALGMLPHCKASVPIEQIGHALLIHLCDRHSHLDAPVLHRGRQNESVPHGSGQQTLV